MTGAARAHEVPENTLETSLFEPSSLETDYVRERFHVKSWMGWTTNIYVALVLTTALIGWLSMIYGNPIWFSLVLFAVPLIGAFLLYRTWPKDED